MRLAVLAAAGAACATLAALATAHRDAWAAPGPENLTVRVLSTYPHDRDAFTQGLLLHDGWLYESTGRNNGEARLRKVDVVTGVAVREAYLPPAPDGTTYWGEGLALVEDRLLQLTWLHGVAFAYDVETFAELDRFPYAGEGWGLCFDGGRLVMSNGSDRLQLRDPRTFQLQGEVAVRAAGAPVQRLNELECVAGAIYANVFMTDQIVRIDAATGAVTAWIDASGLLSAEEQASADVLNGIAYDAARGTFLITGKWWPKLFEVVFAGAAAVAPVFVPVAVRGR